MTLAIFWIAVACCAVAQLAILRSIVVAAARPVDGQTAAPLRAAEILWAAIPALALGLVLLFTWHAVNRAHGHDHGDGSHQVASVAP